MTQFIGAEGEMILNQPCDEMLIQVDCPQATLDTPISFWMFRLDQEILDTRFAVYLGTVTMPGVMQPFVFITHGEVGYELRLTDQHGRPASASVEVSGYEYRELGEDDTSFVSTITKVEVWRENN